MARDFGTWVPQYSQRTMGSFLIFPRFGFLTGGLCARNFSHELTNMISRAMVIISMAVLNMVDFLGNFS